MFLASLRSFVILMFFIAMFWKGYLNYDILFCCLLLLFFSMFTFLYLFLEPFRDGFPDLEESGDFQISRYFGFDL